MTANAERLAALEGDIDRATEARTPAPRRTPGVPSSTNLTP